MWKIGGALVICGLIFGWLRTHDHYVRADALATARRDSLMFADRVVQTQNKRLLDEQLENQSKSDEIEKLKAPLRQQAQKLVKVQTLDEAEIEDLKEEARQWAMARVMDPKSGVVDSLVNKYDDLVLTLKAQVQVAQALESHAIVQRDIMEKNWQLEIEKNRSLVKLNEGLKKELGHVSKGPSVGKIITNYILPTAVATYGLSQIGKRGN